MPGEKGTECALKNFAEHASPEKRNFYDFFFQHGRLNQLPSISLLVLPHTPLPSPYNSMPLGATPPMYP